jgi:hypothetical protein
MLKSLALITVLGAGSTPIAIFTATLADAAMPIRANSTSATLYLSTGLAAVLGFQEDMNVPAVDIGLADVDPRLIKSANLAYALVDYDDAIGMIENMKGQVGRADKDTVLVDADGYAVIMLGAEALKNEPQYAELIDREIKDDSVLILVIGTDAEQMLRNLDISDDQVVIDATNDVPDTFVEFTLGLDAKDGDMPGTGTDSTLGAKPALADA